ncbi:MAG: YdcF family protein [Prochlorococcaceae cyanobacterium]
MRHTLIAYLLRKLLPALLLPHGLALVLLLVALLGGGTLPLLAALILLTGFSLPLAADGLWASLEAGQQPLAPQQLPAAEAIVMLGGEALPPFDQSEPFEAGERFRMALALLRAQCAPQLLFAGSQSPLAPHLPLEGERYRREAIRRGCDPAALAVTPPVQHTAAEASAFASLLPAGATILLITSAFHMPRARRLFSQQGLRVIPVPVDFRAPRPWPGAALGELQAWLPEPLALARSCEALREWLARAVLLRRRGRPKEAS